MATCANLLAELKSIDMFLKSQVAIGHDIEALRSRQAASLTLKIAALKDLTYERAAELTNAFGKSWKSKEVHMMSDAIRKRLDQGSPSASAGRECQSCPTFEFYLTANEWTMIEDKCTTPSTALLRLRNACARIGLLLPDEPTKGRIASIARYCNLPDGGRGMSNTEWYKFLQRVKTALEPNKKKQWHHTFLLSFPSDPRDLPAPIYAAAFDDAHGPPALREVVELGSSVILRKSHSGIRSEETELVRPSGPENSSESLCTALAHMYGPTMLQLFQRLVAQSSSQPPLPHVVVYPTTPKERPGSTVSGLELFRPPSSSSIAPAGNGPTTTTQDGHALVPSRAATESDASMGGLPNDHYVAGPMQEEAITKFCMPVVSC